MRGSLFGSPKNRVYRLLVSSGVLINRAHCSCAEVLNAAAITLRERNHVAEALDFNLKALNMLHTLQFLTNREIHADVRPSRA